MKNLLNYVSLLLLVSCGDLTQVFAANDSEKSSCLLQARVFDADGKEFQDPSAETQVFVFLWQKIADGTVVQGTDGKPILRSSDGSSWQRIGEFYLRHPSWGSEWPVKTNVLPGKYRFSFTISKEFMHSNNDPLPSVGGYTGVKHIHGWGLSDIVTVTAEDLTKTLELRPDVGPKVRLRTTFFPDPATVAMTDSIAEDEIEVMDKYFQEADKITMRIFRDENFPTDAFHDSEGYGVQHIDRGIPWYADFDQMKPGCYYVHFYQGTTLPETGTTTATDVFSFDVTEDGPNEFVFTPEKSRTENAPWQIVGTVRDENGTPMPNVNVSIAGLIGLWREYSIFPLDNYDFAVTDAEGQYRLAFTPAVFQFGTVFNKETNHWHWGFRIQQATIRGENSYDNSGVAAIPNRKGDLMFLGEFATDELKKQLADRPEKMVLVEMHKPAVIDFTVPPQGPFVPWQEWNANPERRKRRFESLEQRKTLTDSDSYKLYREVVVPNSLNRDFIAAMEIGSKITTTLTADKSEFMFHEPIELKWNIANGNDNDISFMTDENMGNSTVVWAVSDDGEVLLENEWMGGGHSGPVQYRRILRQNSLPYEIFLPDKFAIPKPGRYTINVTRNLWVRRIEPAKDDGGPWSRIEENENWLPVSIPVVASITIDVVPTDPVKLGKQIDELVGQLRDRKEGANHALKVLCAIDDERVVPYLVEEIREKNYNAFHAIRALSKFKSDAALEGIKKALTFSDYNLLLSASYALSESKHPQAISELLKNENHPHYVVRLVVVQSAKKMDRQTALEMLRRRFNDPGGYLGNNNEHYTDVAEEARRIYKELTGEGKDEE